MADTAAHLADRVFPEVPIRQWVLSLPFALRYRLAYDSVLEIGLMLVAIFAVTYKIAMNNDGVNSSIQSESDSSGDPFKTPRLSVVVATVDPWPAMRACLESLVNQVVNDSVEIVIADGNGQALPEGYESSSVRWIRKEGGSIFQMRALGLAQARGSIIAFTEDHCKVAHDWCRRVIDLHESYPETGAIGGAVENGADDCPMHCVHFLIANGPFLRPNAENGNSILTGQANVSFKKSILMSESPDAGLHQMEMNRELLSRGIKMRIDDRLVVWHIQSLGFVGTCRMHFHTGRCIGGFRLPHLSLLYRALRIGSCLILGFFLTVRTIRTVVRKKRYRASLAAGFAFLIIFTSCHAIGELAGYLWGAGNSPQMAR